jgi:predicted nicotinamide N-methyase
MRSPSGLNERNETETETKQKRKPMYEVFTREHVAGLAAYFRGRADALLGAEAKTRSLRVLELGAGSGVLSRSLAAATAALDEAELFGIDEVSRASVTYHATDDYSFSFAKEGVSRDEEDDEEENEEENAITFEL